MKRYEVFDHTADVGIIAFGADLPEAFSNAAYAMFDLITDVDKIEETESLDIQVSANDIEELLVEWLNELLFRYETEGFLCKQVVTREMNDTMLSAIARGETLDRRRHEIKMEIKSVTYHMLKVEQIDGIWRLRVVFDI